MPLNVLDSTTNQGDEMDPGAEGVLGRDDATTLHKHVGHVLSSSSAECVVRPDGKGVRKTTTAHQQHNGKREVESAEGGECEDESAQQEEEESDESVESGESAEDGESEGESGESGGESAEDGESGGESAEDGESGGESAEDGESGGESAEHGENGGESAEDGESGGESAEDGESEGEWESMGEWESGESEGESAVVVKDRSADDGESEGEWESMGEWESASEGESVRESEGESAEDGESGGESAEEESEGGSAKGESEEESAEDGESEGESSESAEESEVESTEQDGESKEESTEEESGESADDGESEGESAEDGESEVESAEESEGESAEDGESEGESSKQTGERESPKQDTQIKETGKCIILYKHQIKGKTMRLLEKKGKVSLIKEDCTETETSEEEEEGTETSGEEEEGTETSGEEEEGTETSGEEEEGTETSGEEEEGTETSGEEDNVGTSEEDDDNVETSEDEDGSDISGEEENTETPEEQDNVGTSEEEADTETSLEEEEEEEEFLDTDSDNSSEGTVTNVEGGDSSDSDYSDEDDEYEWDSEDDDEVFEDYSYGDYTGDDLADDDDDNGESSDNDSCNSGDTLVDEVQTEQEVEEWQSEDVPESSTMRYSCPGCQSLFRQSSTIPDTLSCGHSLCQQCSSNLLDSEGHVTCPSCKKKVQNLDSLWNTGNNDPQEKHYRKRIRISQQPNVTSPEPGVRFARPTEAVSVSGGCGNSLGFYPVPGASISFEVKGGFGSSISDKSSAKVKNRKFGSETYALFLFIMSGIAVYVTSALYLLHILLFSANPTEYLACQGIHLGDLQSSRLCDQQLRDHLRNASLYFTQPLDMNRKRTFSSPTWSSKVCINPSFPLYTVKPDTQQQGSTVVFSKVIPKETINISSMSTTTEFQPCLTVPTTFTFYPSTTVPIQPSPICWHDGGQVNRHCFLCDTWQCQICRRLHSINWAIPPGYTLVTQEPDDYDDDDDYDYDDDDDDDDDVIQPFPAPFPARFDAIVPRKVPSLPLQTLNWWTGGSNEYPQKELYPPPPSCFSSESHESEYDQETSYIVAQSRARIRTLSTWIQELLTLLPPEMSSILVYSTLTLQEAEERWSSASSSHLSSQTQDFDSAYKVFQSRTESLSDMKLFEKERKKLLYLFQSQMWKRRAAGFQRKHMPVEYAFKEEWNNKKTKMTKTDIETTSDGIGSLGTSSIHTKDFGTLPTPTSGSRQSVIPSKKSGSSVTHTESLDSLDFSLYTLLESTVISMTRIFDQDSVPLGRNSLAPKDKGKQYRGSKRQKAQPESSQSNAFQPVTSKGQKKVSGYFKGQEKQPRDLISPGGLKEQGRHSRVAKNIEPQPGVSKGLPITAQGYQLGSTKGQGKLPGNKGPQPGNKGPQPGNKGPQPGNKGPQPGNKGPQPGNKGPQPGNKGPQPGNKGPQPGNKGPQPGNKGPQPGNKGPQPGNKGPQPGNKGPQPGNKGPQPGNKGPQPGNKGPQPGNKGPQPGNKGPQPGNKGPQPGNKGPQPGNKGPQPGNKGPQPGNKGPQPGNKGPQPGNKGPQPGNKGPQPGNKGPQPGNKGPQPGNKGPQPGNKGPQPGNKGPQPGNKGPQPGNKGPQPGNKGPQPGNKGPQPDSPGNREATEGSASKGKQPMDPAGQNTRSKRKKKNNHKKRGRK
ncbi:hypothetical protein Pmani_021890 [Petrolisthes manimaculis]|uniref:RING-type domain-containing protein n=1 Tax=Petrolisthes manimaculis TaxID=1843537 RepID=A0AAE1PD56_9EUCA|nr:hypothetical protein Pmani_021890 [Petrolisthes manimaculis]